MAHTPFPWWVSHTYGMIQGDDSRAICRFQRNRAGTEMYDNWEDNAQLIASVPKMVEVLGEVLSQIEPVVGCPCSLCMAIREGRRLMEEVLPG